MGRLHCVSHYMTHTSFDAERPQLIAAAILECAVPKKHVKRVGKTGQWVAHKDYISRQYVYIHIMDIRRINSPGERGNWYVDIDYLESSAMEKLSC